MSTPQVPEGWTAAYEPYDDWWRVILTPPSGDVFGFKGRPGIGPATIQSQTDVMIRSHFFDTMHPEHTWWKRSDREAIERATGFSVTWLPQELCYELTSEDGRSLRLAGNEPLPDVLAKVETPTP